MAQQIADSFFSMCRFDGTLDKDERTVANALQNEVNNTITHRNKFAHGDWWIGAPDTPNVAPELVNMLPKNREGRYAELKQHPPQELEARSNDLLELIDHILSFGTLALGIPVVVKAAGPGVTIAAKREYRVRDVFCVKPGRSGHKSEKAKVVRDGPKAAQVPPILHHVP